MVRSWSVLGVCASLLLAAGLTLGCSDDDTDKDGHKVEDGALPSQDGGTPPGQDKGTPPKQDKGTPSKQDKGTPPKQDKGTPSKCIANTATCLDLGRYRKCNPTGTGYLPVTACPNFLRCIKGVCIGAGKVTGSLSATIQAYYQIYGGLKLKYGGGVAASFIYDAPTNTPYSPPALGTCKYVSYGSSSSKKGVAFDAGKITLTGLTSGTRTMIFSAAKKAYLTSPPIVATELFGKTLTFSSPGKNLIHGAFSGKLVVPPKRIVTSPAHNASHAKSAPLAFKWSGTTGKGELRVDLLDSGGAPSASYVSCRMKDTGSFTIPASYLSTYTKNYPTTIVLLGFSSGTFKAKGLTNGYASGVILAQSDIILK